MEAAANSGTREALQVASHPNRWKILGLLLAGPHSVGELVAALDVGQPSVSHHLARLRDVGLVDVVADGRVRRYAWSQGHLPGRLGELRGWIAGDAPFREDSGGRAARRVPIEVHLL